MAGRPKMHVNAAARVQAYRKRKKRTNQRFDMFLNDKAAWRLKWLARGWNTTPAGVVERLLLEADDRYSDILFPDTESD